MCYLVTFFYFVFRYQKKMGYNPGPPFSKMRLVARVQYPVLSRNQVDCVGFCCTRTQKKNGKGVLILATPDNGCRAAYSETQSMRRQRSRERQARRARVQAVRNCASRVPATQQIGGAVLTAAPYSRMW